MADKQTNFDISIRAITDKPSVKGAMDDLTKGVLNELKNGYIEIPTAISTEFKNKKGNEKLLQAQQDFIDQWKKMSSEGFSSSEKDLSDFIDKYSKFKRQLNKHDKGKKNDSKQHKALRSSGLDELAQFYKDEKKSIYKTAAELHLLVDSVRKVKNVAKSARKSSQKFKNSEKYREHNKRVNENWTRDLSKSSSRAEASTPGAKTKLGYRASNWGDTYAGAKKLAKDGKTQIDENYLLKLNDILGTYFGKNSLMKQYFQNLKLANKEAEKSLKVYKIKDKDSRAAMSAIRSSEMKKFMTDRLMDTFGKTTRLHDVAFEAGGLMGRKQDVTADELKLAIKDSIVKSFAQTRFAETFDAWNEALKSITNMLMNRFAVNGIIGVSYEEDGGAKGEGVNYQRWKVAVSDIMEGFKAIDLKSLDTAFTSIRDSLSAVTQSIIDEKNEIDSVIKDCENQINSNNKILFGELRSRESYVKQLQDSEQEMSEVQAKLIPLEAKRDKKRAVFDRYKKSVYEPAEKNYKKEYENIRDELAEVEKALKAFPRRAIDQEASPEEKELWQRSMDLSTQLHNNPYYKSESRLLGLSIERTELDTAVRTLRNSFNVAEDRIEHYTNKIKQLDDLTEAEKQVRDQRIAQLEKENDETKQVIERLKEHRDALTEKENLSRIQYYNDENYSELGDIIQNALSPLLKSVSDSIETQTDFDKIENSAEGVRDTTAIEKSEKLISDTEEDSRTGFNADATANKLIDIVKNRISNNKPGTTNNTNSQYPSILDKIAKSVNDIYVKLVKGINVTLAPKESKKTKSEKTPKTTNKTTTTPVETSEKIDKKEELPTSIDLPDDTKKLHKALNSATRLALPKPDGRRKKISDGMKAEPSKSTKEFALIKQEMNTALALIPGEFAKTIKEAINPSTLELRRVLDEEVRLRKETEEPYVYDDSEQRRLADLRNKEKAKRRGSSGEPPKVITPDYSWYTEKLYEKGPAKVEKSKIYASPIKQSILDKVSDAIGKATGATKEYEDFLNATADEQDRMAAKRIRNWGLKNGRSPNDLGDIASIKRSLELFRSNKQSILSNPELSQDIKLTAGREVDTTETTRKFNKLLSSRAMEKAQNGGGFLKNVAGFLSGGLGYAFMPSIEKSRAQADGVNQIFGDMNEALNSVLTLIQTKETELSGMQKSGDAIFDEKGRLKATKYDEQGNVIEKGSSSAAFKTLADLEEAKVILDSILADIDTADEAIDRSHGNFKKLLKNLSFMSPVLKKNNGIIRNLNAGLDKNGKALRFQNRLAEILNYTYQLMSRHIGQMFKNWILQLNPITQIKKAFSDFMSYNTKWQRTMNVIKYNLRSILRPFMEWIAQKLVDIIGFIDIISQKIQKAFGYTPISLFDKSAAEAEKIHEELEAAANVTAGFDELHDIGSDNSGANDLSGEIYKPQLSEGWQKFADKLGDIFAGIAKAIKWCIDNWKLLVGAFAVFTVAAGLWKLLSWAKALYEVIKGLATSGLWTNILKGIGWVSAGISTIASIYETIKLGTKWDQMDDKEKDATMTKSIGFGAIAGGLIGGLVGGPGGAVIGASIGTAITAGIDSVIADYNGDDARAELTAALSGAGLGAAIGTAILPGIGTVLGAGIGSIIGYVSEKAFHGVFSDGGAFSNLKISQKDLAWATEEATKAQEAQNTELYKLKLIEEQTGQSGEYLYSLMESGKLTTEQMTADQIALIEQYKKYKEACDISAAATKRMTDYGLSIELQNARTTGSFEDLVAGMVKAKDDGIYTEEEFKDRLAQIYGEIDSSQRETFLETLPENIRESVKEQGREYMSGWDKFTTDVSERWEKFKTNWSKFWDDVKESLSKKCREIGDDINSWVTNFIESVGKVFDWVGTSLQETYEKVCNFFKR